MREFIDKTGLVGKLQILTECKFESANSTVEALPKVTEREIVSPYFEKLKKQIYEAAELYGIETIHVDALTNLIDNLLSK